MKYNSNNKPLVCMQTQSTCYKGTTTMTPKGVLWHSTGANNSTLKRYVQPKDGSTSKEHSENTYTNADWLEVLGKNTNGNDWNHITRQAGLNAWIGKLADGTVTSVQTMPSNYKPWGCGKGSKGSCNDAWIQFEICEDGLTDKTYFDKVYKEACELTAYYCKLYNINPKGTVTHKGVAVPTILCHQDAYKLGLGSNHSDVNHWFKKHGKTMDDVRNDVQALINGNTTTTVTTNTVDVTYQVWDDVKNTWLPNVVNMNDYAGNMGNSICAVYANLSKGNITYKVHTVGGKWLPEVTNRQDYAGIFNQPIDGIMMKCDNDIEIHYQAHRKGGSWLGEITGYNENDSKYGYAGILGKPIDAIRMFAVQKKVSTVTPTVTTTPTTPQQEEVQKIYRVRTSWADSKSQKGAYTSLDNAKECCQNAGEGYKVFDWNGKEVYSYVAPKVESTPIVELTPTPVAPTPVKSVPVEPIPQPEDTKEVVDNNEATPVEPTTEEQVTEDKKEDTLEVIPTPTPVEPIQPENDNVDDDEKIDNIVGLIIKVLEKLFKALVEVFSKK